LTGAAFHGLLPRMSFQAVSDSRWIA
jgi:hypothetical protein